MLFRSQMTQRANQEKDRIVTEAQAQAAERVTGAQSHTAAIVALTKNSQGFAGHTLAAQAYADRVGPLLRKAAQVQTTNNDGAHLILPGATSR